MNPAPGQKAFNWEESAHPRDEKGEFAVKGSGESAKQPDDSEKKITDAAEDYKTNGIKAKAFKDWFGNWEYPGADCSKVVDAKGKPKKNSQVDGKGSKVMKDGKPVVVYHGTSNGQFDRFDKAKIGDGNLYGPGFYFTEDDDIADSYKAKDRLKHKLDLSKGQLATIGDFIENHLPNKYWKVERGEKTGSIFVLETDYSGKTVRATAIDCDPLAEDRTSLVREYLPSMTNWPQGVRENWQKMLDSMGVPKPEIKQVYLNIRKPFDIDKGKVPVTGDMKADYEAFVSIFSEMLEHNPGDTHAAEELKTYKKRLKTGVPYDDALRMFETSPDKKRAMNEYLQSLGYDGITHIGGKIMGDRDHRVWIAFEGNQVKSVNNRGTFDSKDDRMDYSKRIQAAVDRYNKSASEPKKDHEFSSTQIDLPPELAKKVLAMSAKIPDEDLAEDGREDNPHITSLFGLHTNDPDDVKETLYGQRPVEIVMGETSLFENPDADVLKIDIRGDGIHELNKILKKCEHTETHPDFNPHCTVAYLKPGLGKKYTGSDAVNLIKFMADEIMFSNKQREKTPIQLVGESKQVGDRIIRAKELYSRKDWDESKVTRDEDGTFKEWKPSNRFEKADYKHYREVKKRNAELRLPRDGEPADTAEFHQWREDEQQERLRRKWFDRDNVHLVDVPLSLLNPNEPEVDEKRQKRLDEIGGTDDPIILHLDGWNGSKKGLVYTIDDGNNRVHWSKKKGRTHIPAFVHGDLPDFEEFRKELGLKKEDTPMIVDYHLENYSKRVDAVLERYGKKPAKNQTSMFDEGLHPRAEDGKFTEKSRKEYESKKPHELTRSEYFKPHKLEKNHGGYLAFYHSKDGIGSKHNIRGAKTEKEAVERAMKSREEDFGEYHENAVRDAIKRGDRVPAAVLADYPELSQGESKYPESIDHAASMDLNTFAKSQGKDEDDEDIKKAHSALQKRAGVPGMQQSLFGEEASGQKKLFDYIAPTKSDTKKAKQRDLLDGVNERLKAALKSKEALSPADLLTNVTHEPLPGQKPLF